MDEATRDKVYQAARRMGRAYLATVVDDQPWMRPVRTAWDGNDLLIATWKTSPKVRHIQKNPRVQLFYEVDEAFQHLRVTGLAEIVDDPAEKLKAWSSFDYDLTLYFRSPDDRAFTLIRVRSTRIELAANAGTGKEKPIIWRREDQGYLSSRTARGSDSFAALAATAGLDLDNERLAHLSQLWERFLEASKLLGEIELGDNEPTGLLPLKEEPEDER